MFVSCYGDYEILCSTCQICDWYNDKYKVNANVMRMNL